MFKLEAYQLESRPASHQMYRICAITSMYGHWPCYTYSDYSPKLAAGNIDATTSFLIVFGPSSPFRDDIEESSSALTLSLSSASPSAVSKEILKGKLLKEPNHLPKPRNSQQSADS